MLKDIFIIEIKISTWCIKESQQCFRFVADDLANQLHFKEV